MPVPSGVGSENLANPMFTALVGAGNDALPVVDIWGPDYEVPSGPGSPLETPIEKVTVAELVACVEALEDNFKGLLEEQAVKQRITNADYAKTFLGLSQVAMQGAVQFMLGKDQAYWVAVKTKIEAVNAKMENEKLKMEVMLLRAQFAQAKLSLAATDSQFGVSELNRTEHVPAQVTLTKEQVKMVHEQMEAQRAQTVDYREDGHARTELVTNPDNTQEFRLQGLLGVQKTLYGQQIYSYRDDGKIKAGKVFSDLWMTMRTVDEVQPSAYFRPPTPEVPNNPLDGVFKAVRKIATNEPFNP